MKKIFEIKSDIYCIQFLTLFMFLLFSVFVIYQFSCIKDCVTKAIYCYYSNQKNSSCLIKKQCGKKKYSCRKQMVIKGTILPVKKDDTSKTESDNNADVQTLIISDEKQSQNDIQEIKDDSIHHRST